MDGVNGKQGANVGFIEDIKSKNIQQSQEASSSGDVGFGEPSVFGGQTKAYSGVNTSSAMISQLSLPNMKSIDSGKISESLSLAEKAISFEENIDNFIDKTDAAITKSIDDLGRETMAGRTSGGDDYMMKIISALSTLQKELQETKQISSQQSRIQKTNSAVASCIKFDLSIRAAEKTKSAEIKQGIGQIVSGVLGIISGAVSAHGGIKSAKAAAGKPGTKSVSSGSNGSAKHQTISRNTQVKAQAGLYVSPQTIANQNTQIKAQAGLYVDTLATVNQNGGAIAAANQMPNNANINESVGITKCGTPGDKELATAITNKFQGISGFIENVGKIIQGGINISAAKDKFAASVAHAFGEVVGSMRDILSQEVSRNSQMCSDYSQKINAVNDSIKQAMQAHVDTQNSIIRNC